MKLLAIDTSSLACSVALGIGDELLERHEEQPREHTRLLMPMIRALLQQAGVELSALDAIVLGNGPGSFIGMRIAASVCQGLAHGAGLQIVPVSSLAAVAAEVMNNSDADIVAVTQDAHMREVYLGLFARQADDSPQPICAERLHGQAVIDELRDAGDETVLAAGFGWQRYPKLTAANAALLHGQSSVLYPRAAYLLALADLCAAVPPDKIQPAYLRQKVAEKPQA